MKAKKRSSKAGARRATKDLPATPKTKVAGGTVVTNIANMKHEMLKAVAQNLRP
jgi:hypothetical protein